MAKFLIDANLPRRFALWSTADYVFVHDLGSAWKDSEIWAYAAAHDLVIVSKDADFSDFALVRGSGPKVVHVRVGNLTLRDLHVHLHSVWPTVVEILETAKIVHVYRDRVEAIS